MKLIKKLEKANQAKDWGYLIELAQQKINDEINPNYAEEYIEIIYLLHEILLEEEYSKSEHDQMAKLLKLGFDKSHIKFSENAEYLFFIGKILYIAEWYFGINEDLKPVKEREAFRMQQKAFDMEPHNILFEWAYRFSLGEKQADNLTNHILLFENDKTEWLKSRNFAGRYILRCLEQSRANTKK